MNDNKREESIMLRAAVIFFVIALLAFVLGATGFAGLSMEIGKTLLFVFVILALVSGVIGLLSGGGGAPKNL